MTRAAADVPESLRHRLNSYALAASAAGVGALALASPAEGKIVYKPVYKQIPIGVTPLDLNHDRVSDFFFSHTGHPQSSRLSILPATRQKSNRIWGSKFAASALKAGVSVGSKGKFTSQSDHFMADWVSTSGTGTCPGSVCSGRWKDVRNRYLGFKFYIKGSAHYGWARLNVSVGFFDVDATLTGYAYETIPNKPIITGKTKGRDVISIHPGCLGVLARGTR